MKRFSFVCVLTLLGAMAPAIAPAQGVSIGARIGLNRAGFGGADAVDELNSRYGLSVGGFLNVAAAGRLSIQPELLFTQKGAAEGEGADEVALNFNYLEIPVLARLSLGAPGVRAVTPVLFAGPAIGFLLGAEVEGSEDDAGDATDFYKSTDFGLVLGAGLDFGSLSADLRYNLGLIETDDTPENTDLKNRVLSLTFGYAFSLGM